MNLLIKLFLVLITICLVTFLYFQSADMRSDLVSELIENGEESDEDEDEDEKNIVIVVDGFKALQLDEEIIIASGIKSEQVERMFFKPEAIAYAEVIDVSVLVSLKNEFERVLAEQNILVSDLNNHNKILQRSEALHKAKSISARDLDKSRADRDLKSSQLRAVNTHLASIKYKARSSWGEKIASFLFDENMRSDFDSLATNEKKLILLSLQKNKSLDYQNQSVFISHSRKRELAMMASYLDDANHVSNPLYGESYLYLLESKKIRTGMKLFAWIDENSDDIEGLFIPESAVIWYANEPWIYLKRDESLFIRKPLGNGRKINEGWLLEDEHLVSDDLVVTQGGQTLLSEEFKWAIPDEDDD